MFWKKKKQQDGKKTTHESYDVKYENLAVPEVHTEPEVEDEEGEEEQEQEATEQEQEAAEKEPPEVTAESILEAEEEATRRG